MGDRSPKSVQKKATQKQVKTDRKDDKKRQEIASKRVEVKKK